jgi:hypothetical protein
MCVTRGDPDPSTRVSGHGRFAPRAAGAGAFPLATTLSTAAELTTRAALDSVVACGRLAVAGASAVRPGCRHQGGSRKPPMTDEMMNDAAFPYGRKFDLYQPSEGVTLF